METLRLADRVTSRSYPLPVAGMADWRPLDGGIAVDIALPALSAGWIVVPSLALLSGEAVPGSDAAPGAGPGLRADALPDKVADYHQWTLQADSGVWRLPAVPSDAPAPGPSGSDARVSMHLDCWQVHAPLGEPVLRVRITGTRPPARYLLCVSARPLSITAPPAPATECALAAAPPVLSQMSAPADLAPRICSPTSLAMVLRRWGRQDPWLGIVSECRDPATGMYGVWPLAIAAAARRGSIGAVEVFTDWREPLTVLAHGVPLVTSIRFETGELPGAPLSRTGGHLVVVFAAGPGFVAVNDPAAPDADSVTRSYPAAAFSQAWLAHRGAAYIVPP